MRKTTYAVLAAVFCIIFAQSALAMVYMNTPMGNTKMSRTAKYYAATTANATERHLGTGAALIARAAEERARAYDESNIKENIYKMLIARRNAHQTRQPGYRSYKWGVSKPQPYGGIPAPKPAVATAAGNATAMTVEPQNAAA